MTDEELQEAIDALRAARSEATDIEAKLAKGGLPKSVRETLSSFSNSPGGGVIILGLDEADGFRAVGVGEPAQTSSELADMCATQLEPPVRPLIRVHSFEVRARRGITRAFVG